MRKALAGLPDVDKDGVRQIADNKFEVSYAPGGKTSPQTLLDAITTMNYLPTLSDSIAVKASAAGVSFQGKTQDASTTKGKKGKLLVGIFVAKGNTLGGKGRFATVVKVKGPKGVTFEQGETTIGEEIGSKRRLLQLDYSTSEDAKSGEVTVEVTYQGKGGEVQSATFSVPISID